MFRKGIAAAGCLAVVAAGWSYAATTWQLQTKLNTAGGKLQVRDKAFQTVAGTVAYNNFTTSALIPVTVYANPGYKITLVKKGTVALPITNDQLVSTSVDKTGGLSQVVTASFTINQYAITGAVVGAGNISPASQNVSYNGSAVFSSNAAVGGTALTAVSAGTITDAVSGAPVTLPYAKPVKITLAGIQAAQTVTATYATYTVNAGADKVVGLGTATKIYGSVSAGDTVTWTQVSGPATIDTATWTTAQPTFTPAVAGTYVFKATEALAGQSDTVQIVATADVTAYMNSACNGCHNPTSGNTPSTAFDKWSASPHAAAQVSCISCHTDGTMPTPVNTATVDANSYKVLNASAGTVGAVYCAKCHSSSLAHVSVKAACSSCHTNVHDASPAVIPASVTVKSAGTPDVVDAGDSYLPAPTEFAGSNACQGCHAAQFEGWTKSLHNKPTKYLANQGEGILVNDALGTPAGNDFVETFDFNDPQFQAKYGYANPFASQIPNAPILKKLGSDYIIQIGATHYKINRTQGGNGYWKQRYYTEVGGGNYVLPVQFNEASKRYSAYNSQYWYTAATSNTPRFSQAFGSAELLAAFKAAYAAGGDGPASSSWENRCAGCHQSGLTVKLIDGEVVSGYADINVGCEACHGPAAAHAAAPTKANIVNPNDFLSQVGGAYKAVETCGKCHQRGESKVYIGAGANHAEPNTAGSVQKKIEAPAKLAADLNTAIFFPLGDDLFGGGWYGDLVGVFNANNAKGSMTYNGVAGFPTYAASNQHHQQWEDMEQGMHGATYAENTPGAQKMACWSCHDLHSPKGSHNTKSKMTVGGMTLTNLSADNNTLCLACHAGKGKFAALTLGSLQADPTGADVVAAVNAHVAARIPGKSITAANYLLAGRKGGGSSTYGLVTYKNGQCVSCHMPFAPSSSGLRIYADAKGYFQGDQHSHTMKTIMKSQKQVGGSLDSITSCSGCHGDFTDFVAERLQAKTVEAGQTTAGVQAAAGFVGANSCKSCHLEQYAGYTNTFHNKPLKTLSLGDAIFVNDSNNNGINDFKDGLDFNTADASIIEPGAGNWNSMKAAGNAPKLSYESGKYYITIGAVKYEIVRTQGGNGKWKQRFHTKIGNAYYVLPVQFDEISKRYEAYNNGNWYNGSNTPFITQGTSNTDPLTVQQVSDLLLAKNINGGVIGSAAKGPSTASWDNRCAACHQTGVSIEYKSVTGSSPMEVVASSADLNIGCESCHGAGAAHMKNPYAADSIVNPAKMGNAYRATEVCGQCHARVEGFAHFSSATGRLYAGVEAPSQIVEGTDETKAKSYTLGDTLLSYIEKVIPNAWKLNGTSATSAPSLPYVQYEDVANKMANGVAANGHHQQWHDLSSGNHGPAKGMACFACHDPHKPTSGNIKTSAKMGEVAVAVKSNDNSLCLSCHAGKAGAFAALTATDVAGIAAQPNVDAVMEAVYSHLVASAGYPNDVTKKASWKTKYLSSVQADGTTPATFGIATYRVGECISCHMPYSAKSGIRVSTNANGRAQGDQRAHTMKTLWPGLTNVGATGLTNVSPAPITSCSACHPVGL